MRVVLVLTVAAASFALTRVPVQAGQAARKTTWDGVYSEAQAKTGEALYNDKCSKCHGPNAGGGDAPAMSAASFGAVAVCAPATPLTTSTASTTND